MAGLTSLEAAQDKALRGDVEAATAALEALAGSGEPRAAAALAVIDAYRGRWADVLTRVHSAFAGLNEIETYDVRSDLAALAARAARETGSWSELGQIARGARSALGKRADPELVGLLGRLAAYAGCRTGGFRPDDAEEPDGAARFEAALSGLERKKKKFRTEEARADHLYGLARVYDYRAGAIQLFDRETTLPGIFDNIVFLAEGLAGAGRPEEAWGAIVERLDRWWPVEACQVAPVALLTSEVLGPLMTPDRCDLVLRTPRGPAVH